MRELPQQAIDMTKDKKGNEDAKKPKKVPDSAHAPAPPRAPTTPGALAVASLRKKKW